MERTKLPRLLPLVAALFGLIVLFHIGSGLAGHPLIRASHLGTALEYAHGPINLFRPVIVGFNATGTPTALELPLWQAAAGLVFKTAGTNWYGWANLVSLLLFATVLWPFLELAKNYVGPRAAWWALAFFLAQPLIVLMAGEASTDGFCLVVTIWFLFFADKMIQTGRVVWWWPTAIFAAVSAVSKLPFFMAAGICSVFFLIVHRIRAPKAWLLLASAGLVAGLALTVWTRHTNLLAAQAEYPYLDLRLTQSPFLSFWFFGDLAYRFDLRHWIKGGWRFAHGTLGTFPMLALLIAGVIQRGNRLPKFWLVGTFVTTLVFTHLVLAHWHYYLMCCPPVALLCGAILAAWEGQWLGQAVRPWLWLMLAGMTLFFSAVDGLVSMKIAIEFDPFPSQMSSLIRKHTTPGDKLLMYTTDPDWGGELLFRSGRQGLSVMNLQNRSDSPTVKGLVDLLTHEVDLQRLRKMGYDKLVLVSESPVRFAAEAINPGSQRRRRFYPATISPEVDRWPTDYQSEDLLIKQLP